MSQLNAVILAAGKGTRMKSKKHKVLHPVCGKPMIDHIISRLEELEVSKSILVVGHLANDLQSYLQERVQYVFQNEQLGTAHAVKQAKPLLAGSDGVTLILHGDHPLFSKETLEKLVTQHKESGAAATVLTAKVENPFGYGRVIREAGGQVSYVVEQKDANEKERQVNEINLGTYCFDNHKLLEAIEQVKNDNAQGEYYLPDVLNILKSAEEIVGAQVIDDVDEAMGVNDRVQLAEVSSLMQKRILRKHMENGVTIIDPSSTYIEVDVEIGADTIIEPGTHLRGHTSIGENCHIGPQADLTNMSIQADTKIRYAVMEASEVDENVTVGPYAYVRPDTHLGANSKIGCFVDLKKVEMGSGSKVSHLSYVGDATVGEGVNIGCGTVTVNYDGVKKHRTQIDDHAFIGCNVNLIAPVQVGEGAYVAAGSTINKDVPAESLAIARERQTTKMDYAKKLKPKHKK
ncbi:bifunctional UDP-N-acetylglucosamine diphosphorylase/glucosamine-1-phosphate N-acetyltransferase GlmU [Hazenella sp. IB182357]|uniref:Bifunctional protein GlmU n=1 Tax=Polycladospora coralii TaxID=2771432 RepID=A0A926RXF5_9BACL|nr:bifunctional UDP-N-acetylglucosamine diphosphorylase/glucosamine-1-phosphate N-acetyltransferase GlmU [Polycladospora coralii]MBD1372466.1 bifunctional UDP-N-acetylglucosamine diphosphorylase/glucosamine-1-phosphate N-acetyltransferase GlmU [Polycladospora coralii]MBS7531788.1 bifunctional UDP-N-acetylglucosamine diphosphorylase/glucosamine-1-phosphate N-acetyltransferase GlmU [Polycladospora coralii]